VSIAASYPTITPNVNVTDSCILEGQDVTLTCRVTYNGTNLMPLVTRWMKYTPYNVSRGDSDTYIQTNTVNESSVFQSSLTFTATGEVTDNYTCTVSFSSPTGIVLRAIQKQYSYTPDNFTSSLFASVRVASKTSLHTDVERFSGSGAVVKFKGSS